MWVYVYLYLYVSIDGEWQEFLTCSLRRVPTQIYTVHLKLYLTSCNSYSICYLHFTAHTASSSSPADASLCTCPFDSVWAKGGPIFCRLLCRLFAFLRFLFFFFFYAKKGGGDPGPPGPSPRSASGPYQASYIETDSFVKILIKHAVCSCSRFLRHYYQRIIRGLVL